MKRIFIKLNALIFFFSTTFAFAGNSTDAAAKVKFSGFGTLGVVHSDSKIYGYRKDVSSDDGVFADEFDLKSNSLLGLQLNATLTDNIEFVGQTKIRDLQSPSLDRYITLAFLRYDLSPQWSFRAGRTAPDLFLLTEFRDVDFSYTWATAPNELYGILPFGSIDGFDATYTTRMKNGTFKAKLFTGVSDVQIASSILTEIIKLDDFIGVSLSFEQFNWFVNAKYSAARIDNEAISNQYLISHLNQIPEYIWPDVSKLIKQLKLNKKAVRYISASGQYQLNDWLFSAELSRIESASRVIPKITSGYVGLSYHLNSHHFYGLLAKTHSNNFELDDAAVNLALVLELFKATHDVMNFYATNQNTLSLGWRWDINDTVATTLQWNNTRIDKKGGTLWINQSIDSPAETVNTLMFNWSFIF